MTITEKPVRLRENYFFYRVPSSKKSSNGPNIIREIVLDRTLKKHGLDFKQSLYFFRYSEKQKKTWFLPAYRYIIFPDFSRTRQTFRNSGLVLSSYTGHYLSSKIRRILWCFFDLKLVKNLIFSEKRAVIKYLSVIKFIFTKRIWHKENFALSYQAILKQGRYIRRTAILIFSFCIRLVIQLNGSALGVLKPHYFTKRIRELLISNSRFLIYNSLNQLLYHTI